MLKPFFNKTGNWFEETGNLPVIGLSLTTSPLTLDSRPSTGLPSGLPARRCNCTLFDAEDSIPLTDGGCRHYQREQMKLRYCPFICATCTAYSWNKHQSHWCLRGRGGVGLGLCGHAASACLLPCMRSHYGGVRILKFSSTSVHRFDQRSTTAVHDSSTQSWKQPEPV